MAQPLLHEDDMHPRELSVAIIGAGFSGLCMGIQLKLSGDASFVIFDAADEIGGTWRDNTYPGCACDIPSPLYSYSFAQYPYWSELYSPQDEIWQYQKWVVDRYGIKPYLKLGTRIVAASFEEERGVWRLTSAAGEVFIARVVVMAVGGLSSPTTPTIPGLPGFKGATFHSASWDHSYDLSNKRVAVVGTGASAIQTIPCIQPLVGQLFVFQRTPAWVLPRNSYKFSSVHQRSWWWPLWLRLKRLGLFLWFELVAGRAVTTNSPKMMRQFTALALNHLHKQVPDKDLQEKLTPPYSIGCKRVLQSDDYYPALCQPNVQLITSGLAQVKEDGSTLVAEDGTQVQADAIVFCTGFDVGAATSRIDIRGPGGGSLADSWAKDGAQAYLGTAVAGYPNLFLLGGPNSGLGHNSIIFMSECQVGYIMRMLRWMRAAGLKSVDVKEEAQAQLNARLQQRLRGSVWYSGCRSWYLDSRGVNTTLWPGLCMEYWWKTLWVRRGDWNAAKAQAGEAQKKVA